MKNLFPTQHLFDLDTLEFIRVVLLIFWKRNADHLDLNTPINCLSTFTAADKLFTNPDIYTLGNVDIK